MGPSRRKESKEIRVWNRRSRGFGRSARSPGTRRVRGDIGIPQGDPRLPVTGAKGTGPGTNCPRGRCWGLRGEIPVWQDQPDSEGLQEPCVIDRKELIGMEAHPGWKKSN